MCPFLGEYSYSGLWTFELSSRIWHVACLLCHTSVHTYSTYTIHTQIHTAAYHSRCWMHSPWLPRFHPTTINEAGICSTCWTAFCVCTSVRACAVLAPCTPKAIRIALTACVRSRDHKWSRTGALKELISAKILWLYQARSQVLVMHSKLEVWIEQFWRYAISWCGASTNDKLIKFPAEGFWQVHLARTRNSYVWPNWWFELRARDGCPWRSPNKSHVLDKEWAISQ